MPRKRNTDAQGRNFDSKTIQDVWNKSSIVPEYSGETHRYDACGMIIFRTSYGKETDMGWEIDHKNPVANGGTDNPSNLQALQSSLNAQKGDSLNWECPKKKI
jgi:5-methylcytosine-specific restriction endonuclease McrA